MKNQTIRLKLLTALTLSAVTLAAWGCSKTDRDTASDKMDAATDKVADAYQDSKKAVASTWDNVKDYTYEKSNDFKDRAEAMSSDLDAKISKLKADYAESSASASRKAAMEELKNSRADLSDKMKALGNATSATWDSAKANVIAASKRVEAAYDKAKADMS